MGIIDNFLISLSQNLDLHSPFAFVMVFLGGVLVSFTPCVYPLLPVTVGFIGARAGGARLKGFILSITYVLGMAITYSLLGAIAGLSGRIFGAFTQTPLVYFIVANVFLLFGLSMLGLFSLPISIVLNHANVRGKGLFQPLLLGIISGLVVGPCVGPMLGGLLIFVGTEQNVLYGMSLLFVFAYGMGTLLILAGTFTALITSLPKAGLWMERIKRACGIILILCAEYFFIKMGGL